MRASHLMMFGVLAAGPVGGLRAAELPLRVEINIFGPETNGLRAVLRDESQAAHLGNALSLAEVQRVAETDKARFEQVLISRGFYAPTIATEPAAEEKAYRLMFRIETGPKYRVTVHAIQYSDVSAHPRPPTAADTGAALNESANGIDVQAIEDDLLKRLQAQGFPAARAIERKAYIQEGTTNARVVYVVASGPFSEFGETLWNGAGFVSTGYLSSFKTWKEGETFNLDKVNAMRDELADTGLFTRVDASAGVAAQDGRAPIIVDLTERKRHTITAGVSYSTNLGFGVNSSWENRNLWQHAEKLRAEANITQVTQNVSLGFEKPRVMPRTDFISKVTFSHEDDDAFRGYKVSAEAGLKHKFGKSLTVSGGASLSWSRTIDPLSGLTDAYLIGVPLGAAWSNVKQPLDPKAGTSLALTLTPYFGAADGPIFFTQTNFTQSTYVPLDKGARLIAAFWSHVGASLGPGTAKIPPDNRFYAGGAGSVRGYGYRLLGPTDALNKPIGGRSILEGGAELRFPVYGALHGVAFAEAGGIDETGIFQFHSGFGHALGFGLRYATPVGPVRLDIAVPTERRNGIDASYQIYVGLGQAF